MRRGFGPPGIVAILTLGLILAGAIAAPGQESPDPYDLLDRAFDRYTEGDLQAAFDLYLESLPLLLPSLEDGSDAAFVQASLYAAAIASTLGREKESGDLTTRALELASRHEEALSRSLPEGDQALSSLAAAGLLCDLGRYDDARVFARRALVLSRKLGDREIEARALHDLGLVESFAGSSDVSLEFYEEALALHQELGDPEAAVETLNDIGLLRFLRSEFNLAMGCFREVVSRCASARETPWGEEQDRIARTNLAAVLETLGEYEGALEIYQEMLSDEMHPPHEAFEHTSLGRVFRALGDSRRALESLERAEEICRAIDDPGALSNALLGRGHVLCESLGRHEEAQELFSQALALAREIGDRNEEIFDRVFLGGCLLHGAEAESARTEFEQAVSLSREIGSIEGEWTSLAGLGRASEKAGNPTLALRHYLDSISIIERIRKEQVEIESRPGFFESKQEIFGAAVRVMVDSGRGGDGDVAAGFALAERSRARTLLDRFAAEPVGLGEVRTTLEANEAVIAFLASEGGTTAFVVTRDGVDLEKLPGLERLRSLVTRARIELLLPDENEGGELATGAAVELASEVMSPLLRHVPPGVTDLVLVPDGPLAFLPFSALPLDDGRRLVESFAISLTPSASALVYLRDQEPAADPPLELLALADPALPYGSRGGGTTLELLLSRLELRPLPFAREEVRRIASHVGGEVDLLFAEKATRTAFLEKAARGAGIIHLATHSVVERGRRGQSAILLTPGYPGDDGLLLETDLRGQHLSTRLVCLSSCESALGRQVRGEGVLGLARGFIEAGSRSVVCTLWPVEDARSPLFMDHFYASLSRGEPPARALALAQRALLHDPRTAHPSFWASYVVVGESSRPVMPGRGSSARLVLALLAGSVVLVVGLFVSRRSRAA